MQHFPLRFKDRVLEKEFYNKTSPITFKFYIVTLIILGIMCFYSTFLNFEAKQTQSGILTASFFGGIIFMLIFRNRLQRIVPIFTFAIGICIITMNLVGIRQALTPLPPLILIIYFNGFMLGMFQLLLEHLFLKFQVKVLFVVAVITLRWTLLPTSDLIILLNSTFIDLANLLIMYYYERNNRMLFKSFYDYRNELSKFRILLTEHLPHNILILSKKLDRKLFANNSFANNFKVDSLEQIKTMSSNFKINLNTLDQTSTSLSESTFCGVSEPTLLDFLTYTKNYPKDEGHITCFNVDVIDGDENKISYETKVFHLDWDGTPAITIMLNDLTQQQTILALKIADENKDRLLATVSHELRTPINGMLGVTQIIEQEFKDPKLLGYCRSAKVCAKMLLNLVNSILDLAQIRNKCIRLNPTSFKLKDMLDEIESIFRPQCVGKNNIKFLVKKDKGVSRKIVSDQNRLMQVVINLLANALKFTFHGQILLRVTKGQNEDEVQFIIEDSGAGIKEEDKPKLFKAFGKLQQTNPKINAQGVGLGLTISNNLVNLLHPKKEGNKIEFDSVYGQGTTFFFTISTKLAESHEENSDKSDSEKMTQSDIENLAGFSKSMAEYGSNENLLDPVLLKTLSAQHNLPPGFLKNYNLKKSEFRPKDLGSVLISIPAEEKQSIAEELKEEKIICNIKTVLVVDDNSLNLMVASKLLQKLGFDVTTAFNGQDAIQKIKNQDRALFFKLILMDCQMPIMDGFETTQALKKMISQGEMPDVPIFALTANDSKVDQERCIEAGMSGYLVKPLIADELQKLLQKFVK